MAFDTQAALKITKARVGLLMKQPFFGTLALRLHMVQDDTLNPPTMAVDGKSIFYHPKFVNESTPHDVEFVVAHEVMHCVFDHMSRRGGRHPKKWNFANDYVVNAALKDAGFALAPGALYHPPYDGMTSEQVYNLLPDPPDGNDPSDQFDNVRDASPTDQQVTANDWKVAVVQAANAAKARGKLPGALKRYVDEITTSKTDWRARLRQFAVEETKNDYSFQRLNRRYISQGFFLPGLHSEAMGTMVIVTDDSGSIDDDVLKVFAGEIESIRDAVRPQRTLVISCDAEINHIDDLGEYDPLEVKCHGGGGTDFRPPFKYLEEQDITPACLVYLTDLYGPAPKEAPAYPVMWCCTTDQIAPWGETLKIEA